MNDKSKSPTPARRGFLKGALLVTGGVAAAKTASAAEALTDEPQPTVQAKPETTVKYRETDHIKTYYKLARF